MKTYVSEFGLVFVSLKQKTKTKKMQNVKDPLRVISWDTDNITQVFQFCFDTCTMCVTNNR